MIDFADVVEQSLSGLRTPQPQRSGTLVRLVGMTLEARGVMAPLGACCEVVGRHGHRVEAEVVGFNDKVLFLMPFTEPAGVGPGDMVRVVSNSSLVSLGPELLGRVIDGRCQPLDGKPAPVCKDLLSLLGRPINPMERGPINKILDVGIKAINGILTLGRGQRLGLIAGSGVGKSVLLGMLTRFTKADIVIIGLIGERGREVQAFIQESLGEEGLAKSVVIAAPANVSPVLRLKATHLTHVIAEYFRDQGKDVLMLCDSLTRVAHAQREIGLAIGEPPTAKGYPPSVFGLLPNLIERGGVGRHGHGSITAIYTVLAEGDDAADPIVDIARASLDGQVMLSRKLADSAHYPAIDLTGSISRLMQTLLSSEDLKSANKLRRLWSLYQQNVDLIQVGAYENGSNPELDEAIRLHDRIVNFLRQDMHICEDYEVTRAQLRDLLNQS
ncbi:MAG: FliI/YscN family ATPase [Betaproteobacteria bacterium]|nr:FliI/YscN family ATPase [Betaproteobacteria bacterium]NBY34115.1 FliI/YscN family ATPase [Betaproteobacteria bacterium]NDF05121.1 FliI/YscN family ATPase [Betaproteobacteria bacterium]